MNSVRLGVIGVGNMGAYHADALLAGKVSRAVLAAVCDLDPARLGRWAALRTFTDSRQLIRAGLVDAVLIATPHYDHTTIGRDALEQGLHVLVEKPISVHKADCERLISAHTNPRQVFAAMFNQRTDPYYQTIRRMVRDGELGVLRRLQWTITDWFRSEAYYDSSPWRATWGGEGGGVLLNQAVHNLDLFQWMFGMPARVRAFCQFGRYHDIEVEDDVTGYCAYANGATAEFVTSTGEAPGTNRLEVVGDRGRLVYEGNTLTWMRNEVPMGEFSRSTTKHYAQPAQTTQTIPLTDHGGQHLALLQNFVDAILDGQPLIAPAAEGLHSVELANAMLFSTWQQATIELPLDGTAYERALQERIRSSRYVKKQAAHHAPEIAPYLVEAAASRRTQG